MSANFRMKLIKSKRMELMQTMNLSLPTNTLESVDALQPTNLTSKAVISKNKGKIPIFKLI